MPALRRPLAILCALLCALAAGLALAAILSDASWAQTPPRGPFGLGAGRPAEAPGGFVAWMLARQAEFHRALVAALRQAREGGEAGWLVAAGFLYGLFHAAGPGHGKAIVSSYVFANERALRRGVAVAFAAAFVQAGVAVALVWSILGLLAATARQVEAAVRWIEIASFAGIALFGAYLVVRKARDLWGALRRPAGAADPSCDECGRFRLSYRPSPAAGARPVAAPCGHVVIPDAATVTAARSWWELAAVALAAGARPCTGAILILALARVGDVFGLGILAVLAMALGTALATSGFALAAGGAKALARKTAERSERLRPLAAGVELAAALAVTLLGLSLLAGYMAGD